MGIMNEVKSGVDITHPKPTVGYVLAAIVAFAVLGVAYWLYKKAKVATSGVGKAASGIENQASQKLQGFL